MSWTQQAADAMRAIDGVREARVSEASDGSPGRTAFRAFLEIEAGASADPSLLDAALAAIARAGGSGVPGGTVQCAVVEGSALRQVNPARMLDTRQHAGLGGAGGAVQVPAGWLRERYAGEL